MQHCYVLASGCLIALCIKECINIAFLYSSNLKLGSTLFQCSLSSYLAFPKCTGWESGQEGDLTLFRTTGNVMAGKMLHLNKQPKHSVCIVSHVRLFVKCTKRNWYKHFSDGSLHCACVLWRIFFSLILLMHETNCVKF